MAEVARAEVVIIPVSRGSGKAIQQDLESDIDAKAAGDKVGSQFGAGMTNKINSILKGGALLAGGAAIAGIGTVIAKGFQRLDSLDQANAKLLGLGHSAESVQQIMDNALASVQGTAFGMGDAAGVAATMVAAGVKPGEDLERTLKLVGDAATIAGTDLGDMGSIFGKVAASGKLSGDVMQQLMDRQIGILPKLAEMYGVTNDEAQKMVSEGKVSFADFAQVMDDTLGGAALESGSTFQGAMSNMFAAAGRLGEQLLIGIFPLLKEGFAGVMEWLNSMKPAAEEMGAAFGAFIADAGPKLVEVLKAAGDALGGFFGWISDNWTLVSTLATAIGAFVAGIYLYNTAINIARGAQLAFNLVMAANPIMLVITAIAALVAGLVYFFTQTEVGREAWANFTQFLGEAWANIASLATTVWTAISDFFVSVWNGIVAFVTGAVTGVATVISTVVTGISTWWNNTWTAISTFFSNLWTTIQMIVQMRIMQVQAVIRAVVFAIKSTWEAIWNGIRTFFSNLWTSIQTIVRAKIMQVQAIIRSVVMSIKGTWENIWNGISSFFSNIWNNITSTVQNLRTVFSDTFSAIGGFIRNAFSGALSAVKGPINGIIGIVNRAIGALNGLSVSIPDWVPLVGGQTWGVNLPKIPMLAQGGIVSGPTLAMVGEGKYQEAVVPLSPKFYEALGGGENTTSGDAPLVGVMNVHSTAGSEATAAAVSRDLRRMQRGSSRGHR